MIGLCNVLTYLDILMPIVDMFVKVRETIDDWVAIGIDHIDVFEGVIEGFEWSTRVRIPFANVAFDRPEFQKGPNIFGQNEVEEFVNAREGFVIDEALKRIIKRLVEFDESAHCLCGKVAAQTPAYNAHVWESIAVNTA